MTSSEKRMLLPILRKLANHEKLNHRAQSAAEQLYARLTRPSLKSKSGRLRREQKRATHKEETAKIRVEVFARAGGECEFMYPWGRCSTPPAEMDHWLGGSGRRRQKQAVENCWALCKAHHVGRTVYAGGAAAWNDRFRRHCEKYGYSFQEHVEHQAMPRRVGP